MDHNTIDSHHLRRTAIETIADARHTLQQAQAHLEHASAAYRAAVADLRRITPSERATARLIGISQTALRDLLRPVRRHGR